MGRDKSIKIATIARELLSAENEELSVNLRAADF